MARSTATTTATPRWRCPIASRARPSGSRDCRCCACTASASTRKIRGTSSRRTCSRAACSTSSRTPPTKSRFVMSDPDGLRGAASAATRTVTVRTRPEPKPYAGGKVYHVYPLTYKGPRSEPSFDGIMCAYNYVCGGGDTTTTARPRVRAGRHDPGPRRAVPVPPGVLRPGSHVQHDESVRRHLLPDRERHAREADRDQGGGRRRRDSRRRRQLQPVQRQGRQLQLLRGHHLPEYRASRSGPARSSSPDRRG